MVFAFDDYRLDVDRRELRRGRDLVELEPQEFDLLVCLVRHRHRVVSRDDLLREVWDGRIVSDSALATRIHAVRRALGDDGASQRLIRTFTRKGVRFMGDVSESLDQREPVAGEAEAAASASYPSPAPCDRPSIAVLSFANLSNDRELGYFAEGLAEELTIALSRIRWLFVLACRSSVTCNRRILDAKQVGLELSERYAITGSVRRSSDRVRITMHLTDAESGAHLWGDHFDGCLEDVFGLQDAVASKVAGLIEPILQAFEGARALSRPTSDPTAYQAYLRAFPMLSSARRIPAALALLEKAIARDPSCGPALGLAANCYMRLCMDGSSKRPAADARKGTDYAWQALEAAPDDAGVLSNAARPLAYAGENIGMTIALMDRALVLNPNFARGWYVRGTLKYWAGDTERSIAEVETAQRLSPCGRIGAALTSIANALVFSARFEEAIPKLHLAIQEDPSFPPNYRSLAVSYAHLGRLDDARAAIARLPGAAPLSLPNLARSYRAMFRVSEHRAVALSGLRLATGEKA